METLELQSPNRLGEILKEKNLSAYRLAKRIGRNTNTITRVINGERNASEQLKHDISGELEISIPEIFYPEKKD